MIVSWKIVLDFRNSNPQPAAASDDQQKKGKLLEITVALTTSVAFYVLLVSHLVLLWALDVLLTTLVDFAMDKGKIRNEILASVRITIRISMIPAEFWNETLL